MEIDDGLPPHLKIVPPHLHIPLDHPEDADDVEIEVPLTPKDQEVPLKQENQEIVIISDDKDDEHGDLIIEDLDDGVDPLSTDEYETEEDPDDTPYTPRIYSRVMSGDPQSRHVRSRITSLLGSSSRMHIEIPSSPKYTPIHSSEYTPKTPSPC